MNRVKGALWAGSVALVLAGSAFGQFTGSGSSSSKGTLNVTPPKPAKAEDAPMFMTYVSILVIAAAVVGANLIPSKRGHQD